MATAHDVAAYILSRRGQMSAMKLQKLVYYSQAWHLVWDESPLFQERIEAWANGPVVRELYDAHRGKFSVDKWPLGDPDNLSPAERGTIDAVLDNYGHLDARQLSHLTHGEEPWINARGSLPATARSEAEITTEAMAEYYSTIDTADDAVPVDELPWDDWASDAAAYR
ncbi:type II toxin-antitoxin system antitoxin SocA domain-containing protein [Micromonospora costi]|uniref:Panacea domain-containing protein n=1 Tax=Micromonospora costi TaxID=1530042 RepID=UPI0033EFDB6F